MPSTRADILLGDARALTKNSSFGSNEGLGQRQAVTFLNTALREAWLKVVLNHDRAYCKKYDFNMVSGTDTYSMPPRIFLGKEIVELQFSYSGQERDFLHLSGPIHIADRDQDDGLPESYGFLDGSLILVPKPNQSIANALRAYYREQMPRLDVRRGQVDATTVFNISTLVFTTGPILDPAQTATFDPTGADDQDYLSIVDRDGAVRVRNIRFTSINPTTGAVAIASGWTGEAGSLSVSSDHFFTSGHNSTTHSPLDGEFDDFLRYRTAALMAGYDKDTEGAADLNETAKGILEALATAQNGGRKAGPIPIPNFNDYGDPKDWY